jgi:5-(carboxyamino)imidazole ribonucleotide mutase
VAEPLVAVLMGSRSDWAVVQHACDTLDELGIANEARVLSAHRSPDELAAYVEAAEGRGIQVLIAAAGMAAALPGAIAAKTALPVLGVPIEGALMGGLDAVLAMVQMPPGIPVGTLAVGKAGAKNAALLAAAILGLQDADVRERLHAYRRRQTEAVLAGTDPRVDGGS